MDVRIPRVDARMSESPSDNLTFEQCLAELDRVVRALEDGQLGLEEALAQYEIGIGLLKRCHAQLQKVEQRILQLTGVDAEGRPVTQPFDHAATAESVRQVTQLDHAAAESVRQENRRKRKKEEDTDILF
jgi:exodeoxyribonuclease VII small subunit